MSREGGGRRLDRRVAEAAEIALATGKHVTFVDVLTGLRWVHSRHVDTWRQGRVASLEQLAAVDGDRMLDTAAALRSWATAKGLTAEEVPFISSGRDHGDLRFTLKHSPEAERPFRIAWLSPDLTEARRRQITERQAKVPDLVVVAQAEPFRCAGCGTTGPSSDSEHHLIIEDHQPFCLTCADMDHLIFLPAGDAALTRRAKKESSLSAVVVHYNRRRKHYERQGLLVEEAALARAEEQCLADEEVRARRRVRDADRRAHEDVVFQAAMAAAIRRLFPGCPQGRAEEIAAHAALRGSGRVGRTAAAKVLDENAVTLAVVASVRHADTDYDRLLMSGVDRMAARDQIRARIDQVLAGWRPPPK
ncbi:DUF2293 domain-containing protein [Streptosporangiaceae bacterium NEAU-GS5]|nr:DUF2293 domain-containing protein [Streptosporangiaceae bacterium NEAU-GS5]